MLVLAWLTVCQWSQEQNVIRQEFLIPREKTCEWMEAVFRATLRNAFFGAPLTEFLLDDLHQMRALEELLRKERDEK